MSSITKDIILAMQLIYIQITKSKYDKVDIKYEPSNWMNDH
jgi:hypothetical protein